MAQLDARSKHACTKRHAFSWPSLLLLVVGCGADASKREPPGDDASTQECGEGLAWYRPGCGELAPAIREGCYRACDPAAEDPCPRGLTCQDTDVEACHGGDLSPGTETCAACGTVVALCRPAVDAPEPDGGGPDGEPCAKEAKAEASFVAANSACVIDDDCAVVGSCSNADFLAVRKDAIDAAEALIAARTCKAQDGPTYHARCIEGRCERVLATEALMCGGFQAATACPSGYAWRTPGCNEAAAPLTPGCYALCDPSAPDACGPGFTCQDATIDPCGASEGQGACDVCEASVSLCRPVSDCSLAVSLTLDGTRNTTLHQNEAVELVIDLENVTDAPITFSYIEPCTGTVVDGLDGYDLWDRCTVGFCGQPPPITVTLAAHEKRVLARRLLTPLPWMCNEQGLAAGTYTLSASLSEVEGVTLCGVVPAELTVLSTEQTF